MQEVAHGGALEIKAIVLEVAKHILNPSPAMIQAQGRARASVVGRQ